MERSHTRMLGAGTVMNQRPALPNRFTLPANIVDSRPAAHATLPHLLTPQTLLSESGRSTSKQETLEDSARKQTTALHMLHAQIHRCFCCSQNTQLFARLPVESAEERRLCGQLRSIARNQGLDVRLPLLHVSALRVALGKYIQGHLNSSRGSW